VDRFVRSRGARPRSRPRLINGDSGPGLPLETDGLIAVPGGLVPLLVSSELGVGCDVEPNVWVEHTP
jgi:hypothetical protein